jgi:hypothetical protein
MSCKHTFFNMTGRCSDCGLYRKKEQLFQRRDKPKKVKKSRLLHYTRPGWGVANCGRMLFGSNLRLTGTKNKATCKVCKTRKVGK